MEFYSFALLEHCASITRIFIYLTTSSPASAAPACVCNFIPQQSARNVRSGIVIQNVINELVGKGIYVYQDLIHLSGFVYVYQDMVYAYRDLIYVYQDSYIHVPYINIYFKFLMFA